MSLLTTSSRAPARNRRRRCGRACCPRWGGGAGGGGGGVGRRARSSGASGPGPAAGSGPGTSGSTASATRSEEHTSELQSRQYLVCRLLLEKKTRLFCSSLFFFPFHNYACLLL